jgi:hypothetical protein
MSVLSMMLVALGGVGALGALVAREHRLVRAARTSLLERCANVLDGGRSDMAVTGFLALSPIVDDACTWS